MQENMITVKVLLAGMIAAGTAMWGWLGWLFLLWIICMALDYASGTLAAMKRGEWSSGIAREGLWHKGGMILVVLVAVLTDVAISLILRSGVVTFPFDHSTLLTVIALSWYTITELGSALENATRITSRVPKWLSRFLAIAADAVDDVGDHVVSGTDDKVEGDADDKQP